MGVTYTITRRAKEGNRNVHYGKFTMVSGDCSGDPSVIRELKTGLRVVDRLEVWEQSNAQLASGIVTPRVAYPVYRSGDTTVWPAYDKAAMVTSSEKHFASGNFTVEFTSTAGPILWKATGRV
jgi:hypothetical protein